MMDFITYNYEWIRALHIISVISWMAGMLYLPRLFIYHVGAPTGSEMSETFKVMERRLMKIIMNPAMIATWIFGLLMLYDRWDVFMHAGWMHAKLTCILLMSAVHGIYAKYLKAFAKDQNVKSAKFFRILNEIPTLLMIIIVIMAVVEPF